MNKLNKRMFGLVVCVAVLSLMCSLVMALDDTDTGIIAFEITETVDITFATSSSIDFGAGSVDSGETSATLDSDGGNIDGSWTNTTGNLTLENIGTEDATLDLVSNVTAAQFIGGSSPTFKWKVANLSVGSCDNIAPTSYAEVNTTVNGTRICSAFYAEDSKDDLNINFELVIPSDTSLEGAQVAVITATATEIND